MNSANGAEDGRQHRADDAPADESLPCRFFWKWLRLLLKWKRLVWLSVVMIVGVTLLIAFFLPPQYTATVVILPPQGNVTPVGVTMMSQQTGSMAAAAAAGFSIKNPNDQQIALLKSRVVEDAMVERFNLQSLYRKKYRTKARQRWEKVTQTDSGLKDGLIRLSVTDNDPHRAAAMANAWVEEYRRFAATLALTEAAQRRLFYQRQLEQAQADLAHAEEGMKQTAQHTGIIDLEGQDRSRIATAASLRGQLAAKQIAIRGLREFAAPGNPDLQRAQQEAAELEAQLAAIDATSDRKTGDLVAPKGELLQSSLAYERALREVKYRETIQNLLARQYEGARVDEARQGTLIQIVEPAVVPECPNNSRRLWVLVLGWLSALPLAWLFAVLAETGTFLRQLRRCTGSWTAALAEGIAKC